jgi:protein-tyrosine kinase
VSARRGENPGAGDVASDDGRDDRTSDAQEPVDESNPRTNALAVRGQGQVVVAESRRVKTRAPIGMASREQLDAFRELRTRLVSLPAAAELSHFTTVIVPVSSGSGASFVARNLAAAFALEERRLAILVDCNLRNPTQHTALGMPSSDRGLFDYLERPHGGVERLICPTSVPGLHLIPAGRPPSFPREYLSSQAMRMVMNALRQPSCYVFLDSPPAKGAPDARILSDLADFVVLVVGYGRDTPADIQKTAAIFDPTKFAGVVFNERV